MALGFWAPASLFWVYRSERSAKWPRGAPPPVPRGLARNRINERRPAQRGSAGVERRAQRWAEEVTAAAAVAMATRAAFRAALLPSWGETQESKPDPDWT